MPAPAWRRLECALRAQPAHAPDALADLRALTAGWSAPARLEALERFTVHARSGVPLPAAFIHAVSDLLGANDE